MKANIILEEFEITNWKRLLLSDTIRNSLIRNS